MNQRSSPPIPTNGMSVLRLWPILPPLLLVPLGLKLQEQFASTGIELISPYWDATAIAGQEGGRRFHVGATFLLLIIACVAAMAVAIGNLWKVGASRASRTFWFACAAVVSGLAVYFSLRLGDCIPLFECMASNVFADTVGSYPPNEGSRGLLTRVLEWGTGASALAGALIATAVASLHPGNHVASGGVADQRELMKAEARVLAARITDLKRLLMAAAAMLFVGAVHLKSWLEWPLAFWSSPDSAGAKSYEALAHGVLHFKTLHFTLILAAIFLPMALVLSAAGRRLVERDEELRRSPEKAARWLQGCGLTLSPGEQAQRVLALISPFLASPVIEVLKQVGEKLT